MTTDTNLWDLIPTEGYCEDCGKEGVKLGMVALQQMAPDEDHPDPDYIGPCQVLPRGKCIPCTIAFAKQRAGGVH